MAAAATSLNMQAQELVGTVSVFQLGNVDGRTQPVAATAPQTKAKPVPTYMPAATVAVAYRAG